MKLDRLEKIKNHKIFNNFQWGDDLPDFAKYNLIYGWNGSGKTTLSNIFCHLQDTNPVIEGDVHFKIDNGIVKGSDLTNINTPDVKVFNRDTVDSNLFEVPNHELPPVYYVGKDSAENQKKIEELKSKLDNQKTITKSCSKELSWAKKNLDDFCIDNAGNIKNLLTKAGGGPYNNYHKTDFKRESDLFIGFTKASFCLTDEEHEKCLQAKDSILLKDIEEIGLVLPDYLELTSKVQEILKISVVSSVIEDLRDNPSIASWVYSGLELHSKSDVCHFCKNEINNNRIKDLEAHFSDEFSDFQKKIDSEINNLQGYKVKIENLILPAGSLFYPHLFEKYQELVSSWESKKQNILLYLTSLINALYAKKDSPFKSINIHDYISISTFSSEEKGWLIKALGFVVDMAQNSITMLGINALKKLNDLVSQHNNYGNNFKSEVDKSRNDLAIHAVSINLEKYESFSKVIKINESSLAASELLEKKLTDDIEKLEQASKKYAPAADELNKEIKDYLGRSEIRFEPKDNGYIISRNGEPAMDLSEGERTAITFMYFLKTLSDKEFDIKNSIVVIDDPISSLDANSMYSAFGFMKEKTKNAGQLFVLTHSFQFFRLVRGWFFRQPKQGSRDINKQPSRFYMVETKIENNIRAAFLTDLDSLLRDYESEYHYLFKRIYEESKNEQKPESLEIYYGLPNIGRRLLEAFLTFKLPGYEAGKLEKKLDEIKYDSAKKTRILRFLHVQSHFDQIAPPEHDLSILSETPEILNDLMGLIESIDKEHFDGMKSFFVS